MKIFFKKIASLHLPAFGGSRRRKSLIILIVFIIAFLLRIYGLNWDNNNHLHPDERFLTMVVNDVNIPSSFSQYFNTTSSPLNPYNYPQYQFFVYGTFPLFITKLLAVILHLDNYNHITLLGRLLSALFDSGNIFLLYFISKKILKSYFVFFPSLFYAFLVLPLQLSHYFAVDTFLTFFILLTFTFFTYKHPFYAFISFGFALACKISAVYFSPIILIFLIREYLSSKDKTSFLPKTIICVILSFITFRILQPYAFTDLFTLNTQFINNLKTLSSFSSPDMNYPPGVQWINRLPLINSIKNTGLWGLGLAISLSLIILLFRLLQKIKVKFNLVLLISFWVLLLFTYQSIQFVHAMRYLLPIYPFICLLFAYLLSKQKISRKIIFVIIFCNSLYAFSFLSIYSRPNSRVQATNWITQNIPLSKTISSEYWDDALPLGYSDYKSISLPFYDAETPEKWVKLNNSLNRIDYLIMSSNRLWGSIPRVPEKYPLTSKFYEDLFSEKLDFNKIMEFNSYPGFSISFLKACYYLGFTNYPGIKNKWFTADSTCLYPGIYLRDDTAEEAFSVYDHPKVLIFKKR